MKPTSVGVLALTAFLAGCVTLPTPTAEQEQRCIVYVLPGIEGKSHYNLNIAKGLLDGRVDGAVEVHDWTTGAGPLGWFIHLADKRRNRIEAIRLARRIVQYLRENRNRPVYIVAHSGGAGIALQAVEKLPIDSPVDAVVLLGAAVSPERNLSQALARTRRGIWNFHSRRDFIFLVLGTSLFGTIDRRHGPSAGAVGFTEPGDLSHEAAELYATKLHQIPYTPIMAADGNRGGHADWTHPKFVAKWIAPIIKGQRPPEPCLDNLEPKETAGTSRSASSKVPE
jgi:pimeloyl-ACP methyl ester carboxylesterase